jgi:hypothetical protein
MTQAVRLVALDTFLMPGGLLADRDGDGLADTVRARFMLGPAARRPEYAAATDLAARLGLASLSCALALAASEDRLSPGDTIGGAIPVFVGRPATVAADCPPVWERALRDLAPGDGLVAAIGEAEPALLVGGADEGGLAAAAFAVATSAPHLPIDTDLDAPDLAAAVRSALADHPYDQVILEAVVIRGGDVVEARIRLAPGSSAPPDLPTRQRLLEALGTVASGLPCDLVITVERGKEGRGDGPAARLAAGRPRRRFERSDVTRDREMVDAPLRSLADLYGPEGLCVDSDGDLLPDLGRVRIDLPVDLAPPTGKAVIDLGARIGLETLGLGLPLASASVVSPSGGGEMPPGRTVSIEIEALGGSTGSSPLGSGEGEVRAVGGGERGRIVVRGGDERGRALATHALATLDAQPSEDGVPTVQQIEERVRRFCALAEPDARAAAVVAALNRIPAAGRRDGDEALIVRLPLDGASATLRAAAADAATAWGRAQTPSLPVHVAVDPGAQPVAAVTGEQRLDWEVDDVWLILTDTVFPALQTLPSDAVWELDVRVSEPAGRRAQLGHAIRDELAALGVPAAGERIHIRPAYRQGRAWLLDEVVPHLQTLDVRTVTIRCQPFVPDGPCLELPIRWIQELHPVDELIRDRLGLPDGAVRIEMEEIPTTYEVEARGPDGAVVWQSSFEALHGTRPYLPGFPAWGAVHPCTGCVRLLVTGEPVVDRRVAPDPERAWDVIQGTVLPALRDHVHQVAGSTPRPRDQPFFGSLTIDVWLSEDDRLVGVREERESPLESLHEDIYFDTLDYCAALLGHGAHGGAPYIPPWVRPPDPGEPRRGARLWTAPGSVIPRIHRRDGRGGTVCWRLIEAPAREPALAWRRGEDGGTVPLVGATRIDVRVAAIRVAAAPPSAEGTDEGTRHVILAVDGRDDERARAIDLLRAWARVREALPARDDPLHAGWGYMLDDGTAVTALWPAVRGESTPAETAAPAPSGRDDDARVPWDRVLVQADIDPILTRLRESPRVRAYEAGRSARGRPSYAIEVTTPRTRGVWSRAKMSAWKCTLLLNARHHANEASSTSALLRLAALLAFDPAWQPYLARVNVVLIPYENPDGAALHGALQDEHPTWMLHAGRYNADGLEFTSAYSDPLTPHGEARVLPSVWRRWAPDIVSDDHGFPSHEWVQPFAGHSNAWFRSDWIPQGLIYVFLARAVNPRYPRHAEAVDDLRARMVQALSGDPVVRPCNRVYADRYRTFLHRWLPDDFPAPYEDDVLIHVTDYDPENAEQTRASLSGFAGAFPGVTTATLVTEVADETAQGRYMAVCAHAHLTADHALLQYLYDVDAPSQVRWERGIDGDGATTVRTRRPRPAVRPHHAADGPALREETMRDTEGAQR